MHQLTVGARGNAQKMGGCSIANHDSSRHIKPDNAFRHGVKNGVQRIGAFSCENSSLMGFGEQIGLFDG